MLNQKTGNTARLFSSCYIGYKKLDFPGPVSMCNKFAKMELGPLNYPYWGRFKALTIIQSESGQFQIACDFQSKECYLNFGAYLSSVFLGHISHSQHTSYWEGCLCCSEGLQKQIKGETSLKMKSPVFFDSSPYCRVLSWTLAF